MAILPVVLFHAGVRPVSGGFVGVDIFFVISGYVITRSLLHHQAEGKLSLLGFYNRRVRRLFPALFAVLIVTSIAAAALLLPRALKTYGAMLIACAVSLSNIFFYRETGYFDTSAAEKPLLHTWSLSVEEQFYFVWPTLLGFLFIPRLHPYRIWLTAAALIGSFALSVWMTLHNLSGGFYLPQSRAWELVLGAILALAPLRLGVTVRHAFSVASLIMMGGAILLFTGETPFPGVAAALPALGAALAIMANDQGDTLGAKILSWRPVVYVGLISYSLWCCQVNSTGSQRPRPHPDVHAAAVAAAHV